MRVDMESADVVVSCRVRLARNLRGFSFAPRLAPERASELAELVEPHLEAISLDGETHWVPMDQASVVLRLMLRERHLISRDLVPEEDPAGVPAGRAVAFGESERISVMVNEEDHLRIQSVAPGFDLDGAFGAAEEIDRHLEGRLPYSFTQDLGYLTGCPTNVGTGMRASVMLHLPALGLVRSELEKVFTAAQRTGLAVRGLYGEGSRAVGDFFQISNQITLGRTESSLIDDLRALVPVIASFERKVRTALLDDQPAALQDRVSRSLGVLRTSRSLATEAALGHLSTVRLGRYLGLLDETPMQVLNELGVQVQKGHILALSQAPEPDGLLPPSERDSLRAGLIRQRLSGS
jgi:protein arginine kinase